MNAFANDVILNRDYMPNDGIFIKNETETKTKIATATETKSLFLQMGLFFLCVRFTTFDFARLEFMWESQSKVSVVQSDYMRYLKCIFHLSYWPKPTNLFSFKNSCSCLRNTIWYISASTTNCFTTTLLHFSISQVKKTVKILPNECIKTADT